MNKSHFGLLAIAATLADPTVAFWGKGHLLVARGGQAILENQDPQALQAALDVLATLTATHPDQTTAEGSHPFTECADFADEIKGSGGSFQKGWHFINQPYLVQGGSLDDYDFTMPDQDIVQALNSLVPFLKGNTDYSDFYQNAIQNAYPNYDDQLSFALRLVIHYAGDIHQPLHVVAAIDAQYPHGDAGGNYESVSPQVDGVGNLHQVWDSVDYDDAGYPVLPISDSDWTWYTETSASNMQTWPIDDSQLKAGDFEAWAAEGLEFAETVVYPGFFGGSTVTDAYKKAALPVVHTQMNYGSARLAELISEIYGKSSSVVEQELFLQ